MSPILNDNILPLTPNPGTAKTMPLVTAEQYQEVTTDTATPIPRVESLIQEAIEDLSKKCGRTFAYGQYTEAQYLYPNGMVYPSATPIDVTQVISAAVEGNSNIYDPASDDPFSSIVQGDGVWVGWFSPLPWMPYYTGVIPPQTILTYYGGWQNSLTANPPAMALPSGVLRMICRLVYIRANPVLLNGLPAGVTSMSVGGVSIAGPHMSLFMEEDPDLRRMIKRWRHPHGGFAWQS